MIENSGENSPIRAIEVERALDSDGDGDHDEKVLMKRMISNHPLFELLIDTHLNCLKVGLCHDMEDEKVVITTTDKVVDEATIDLNASSTNPTTPDLDRFMEAYCIVLNKLKEAMEEPLLDATSFITNMYAQLKDLSATEHAGHVDDQTSVLNCDK